MKYAVAVLYVSNLAIAVASNASNATGSFTLLAHLVEEGLGATAPTTAIEATGDWIAAHASARVRWLIWMLLVSGGLMGCCYLAACHFLRRQRRMQARLYEDGASEHSRLWRRRRAITEHIMTRMNGFTGGRFEYELHEMHRALR